MPMSLSYINRDGKLLSKECPDLVFANAAQI